jgi:hypothetical protein
MKQIYIYRDGTSNMSMKGTLKLNIKNYKQHASKMHKQENQ